MSSTNRGGIAEPNGQNMTPPWTVHKFIQTFRDKQGHDIAQGAMLEPCAGTGNIIRACYDMELVPKLGWDAGELDEKFLPNLQLMSGYELLYGTRGQYSKQLPIKNLYCPQDFLTFEPKQFYSAVLTNPPFFLAWEFLEKSWQMTDVVILLLRLNWLGSIERHALHSKHRPDIYVITPRPSFLPDGSTDSCEYAFFVWAPWSTGSWYMLELGPTKRKNKVPRVVNF